MRDSAIFYRSWKQAVDRLGDGERGRIYEIILDYAIDGKEPTTDDPVALMVFDMVRVQIDVNNKRYENGKRGGRPKNEAKDNRDHSKEKPKQNQTKTKRKPNENVNANDNVNDNDNIGRAFKKPTVDQVRAYCQERRNGIDPQQFVDFYEARGWKLAKGVSMKDWRASVRTWERNGISRKNNRPPERGYDMGELELKLLASN